MNLTHLRTLQAVAEHASYTRAAEALYLSQPSVYLQIRALERSCGQKLVEPEGRRRVRLTSAGRLLLHYAQRVTALVDEAQVALADTRPEEPVGRLSLGVARVLTTDFLPYLLCFYHARFPGVELDTHSFAGQEIGDSLLRRELDLGIQIGPPHTGGVVSRPFWTDPLVAVAAPAHPLAGRRRITLDELATYPLVDRSGSHHQAVTAREWLAAHGVPVTVALTLPGEGAVRLAARLGMGVAILARVTVADDVNAGRLCVLDVEGIDLTYEFHVAWVADERLRRPVRAMIDLLCDTTALSEALAPAAITAVAPPSAAVAAASPA